MNLYNVYFVSKGTGPRTVQIVAQNSAGVKAQVEARYPGAYNTTLSLFVEAAVERMFNADEVTSVVNLAKLECLKRKIVSLFFEQRELI